MRRTGTAGVVLLVAASAFCAQPAQPTADVVARVNGEPVTRSEFDRMRHNPLTRQGALDHGGETDPAALDRHALRRLVQRRLMLQEAARRSIVVSDEDVDRAVGAMRRQFDDLRSFGQWMQAQQLDDRSLFDSVRADLTSDRVSAQLTADLTVADDEAVAYYRAHAPDFVVEEVRLQLIVVEDRDTAERVLKAAVHGREDFGRLARTHSRGQRASQGGDTGWVPLEGLWPPLRDTVRGLKSREATGPLRRGEEFIVVRLHDRRPGRAKTFEEARPDIERALLPRKRSVAIQAWLTTQEQQARIEVFR